MVFRGVGLMYAVQTAAEAVLPSSRGIHRGSARARVLQLSSRSALATWKLERAGQPVSTSAMKQEARHGQQSATSG